MSYDYSPRDQQTLSYIISTEKDIYIYTYVYTFNP